MASTETDREEVNRAVAESRETSNGCQQVVADDEMFTAREEFFMEYRDIDGNRKIKVLFMEDAQQTFRGDRITVSQAAHTPHKTRLRMKRTGGYIQFSNGGLIGRVLGSVGRGVLNMENFIARRQTSPNGEPDVLFCCRIFVERDGITYYLSYIPNAENGARVQFQPFRKDTVTSDNLDGRCFRKLEKGNYTLFGSLFNDDLFMYYDKMRRKLLMRRVKSLSGRLPDDFLFSEAPFTSRPVRPATAPSKPFFGLLRKIPCMGYSDTEPELNISDN